MRSRANGGMIGKINVPATYGPSGVFGAQDQENATLKGPRIIGGPREWPAAKGDPYRAYVAAHLGDCATDSSIFTDVSQNQWDKYTSVCVYNNGGNNFNTPAANNFSPNQQYYSSAFNNSEYLTINNDASLILGTDAFLIECWIYMTNSQTAIGGATMNIVSKGASSGSGWSFSVTQGNKLTFAYGAATVTDTTTLLQTYKWYHVAVYRVGTWAGAAGLSVNGVQVQTFTCANNFTDTTPMYVGADRVGTAGTRFNGLICDLRLQRGSTAQTPNNSPAVRDSYTQFFLSATAKTPAVEKWTETTSFPTRVPMSPYADTDTSNQGSYFCKNNLGSRIEVCDDVQSANTSLRFGTGDFTVEGWFNMGDTGLYAILGKGTATTGWEILAQCGTSTTSKITFNDGSTSNVITLSVAMWPKTWNHIALVRTSGTITIFVNGVAAGSFVNTTDFSGSERLNICYGKATTQALYGFVSNVHISKIARYTGNFTPVCPAVADSNTSLLILTGNGHGDVSMKASGSGKAVITTQHVMHTGPSPVCASGWSFSAFSGTATSRVTTNAALTFAGDFAIECFVKLKAAGYYDNDKRYVFDNRSNINSSGDIGYALQINSTWAVEFVVTGTQPLLVSTTRLDQNWHHICIQRVNGKIALYIDGVLEDHKYSTLNLRCPNDLKLCASAAASQAYFLNGYMSNLRISSYARYSVGGYNTKTIKVPTSTLVADGNTVLLTACGPIAMDYSPAKLSVLSYDNPALDCVPISPFTRARQATDTASFGLNTGYCLQDWEMPGSGNKRHALMSNGVAPWTLEVWVYIGGGSAASPEAYNIMYTAGGTGDTGFRLIANSNGTSGSNTNLTFAQHGLAASYNIAASSSYLKLMGWNHIVVCNDGARTAMFVNGALSRVVAAWGGSGVGTGCSYPLTTTAVIAELRISNICRYDTYATSITVPSAPYTADADTITLIQPRSMLPETTGRNTFYKTGRSIATRSVKKFGKGSWHFLQASASADVAYIDAIALEGGFDRSDSQNLVHRLDDYTIEGWFKWDGSAAPNGQIMFSWAGNYASTAADGTYQLLIGSLKISTNVQVSRDFDHIVVMRRSLVYYLFVNGVLAGKLNLDYSDTSTSRTPDDLSGATNGNALVTVGAAYTKVAATAWVGYAQDFRITQLARYDVAYVGTVPTLVHVNTKQPALPTELLPTY